MMEIIAGTIIGFIVGCGLIWFGAEAYARGYKDGKKENQNG